MFAPTIAGSAFEETDDPEVYVFRGDLLMVCTAGGETLPCWDGCRVRLEESDDDGWHQIVEVIPTPRH